MPIISSTITLDNPQVDGRFVVRELHIDDQGNEYNFDYMADAGMDINARLAARADELNAELAVDNGVL